MSAANTVPAAMRPGFSSVLATFYVALFSGLAISFVAFTSLNTSIAGNARAEQCALTAAEGGLSIMRYHLCKMTFPADSDAEDIFNELADNLFDIFSGTLNLSGRQIIATSTSISIPPIPLDVNQPGLAFSVEITRQGDDLSLTVTGHYQAVRRAIRVTFAEHVGPPDGGILRHGIASRGAIRIDGSALIRSNIIGGGSVFSADPSANPPIRVNGAGQFDGDFYMVKAGVTANQVFSSSSSTFIKADGSGYESDIAAHTHSGVPEPAWPTVDVSTLAELAQTLPHKVIQSGTDISSLGPLHNLVIKANANPTFASGVNITGIVYVEWPNDVVFNGSATITGIIVCQPPPYEPSLTQAATNLLRFNGAVTSSGVENLPQTPEYEGLHGHTGSFLLAPDYEVVFNGAMGTINGMIYASELDLNGTTTGTIRGGILIDRRRQFTKFTGMDVLFLYDESTDREAAGIVFDRLKTLRPVQGSYQEL